MIKIDSITVETRNKTIIKSNQVIEIPPGITYLMGVNGAGKSVLLYALLDIMNISVGEIKYDGNSSSKKMTEIAMIFDQPNFILELTGYENLCYLNQFYGEELSNQQIELAMGKWGLEKDTTKVNNYSLGMKKKLTILSGLVFENKNYYFFDEPYNGLDLDAMHLLDTEIKKLKALRKTVIMTTHDVTKLAPLVDHVLVIENKKLYFYPNTGALLARYTIDSTISQIHEVLRGERNATS